MATFNGKVIDGGLNLRKTASSSGTILVQIPENTNLTLIEESGKTAWFKTTYNNKTGYVMAEFIAITNDGGTCTNTSSGKLNIRKTPSSSANVLYQAAVGGTLRLLDYTSTSGWYRVSSSKGTGWAMSNYLTINTYPGAAEEDDEEEVTPTPGEAVGTIRFNAVTCYKTSSLDEDNTWGTFPKNATVPVWFMNENNTYYKTTWTVNGVEQIGYIYSSDVMLNEDLTGTIEEGAEGNTVINCKQLLSELGYHPYRYTKVFDSILEASVRVFQVKNGLTETGKIDSATRAAINSTNTFCWIDNFEWTPLSAPHQWFMSEHGWGTHPFPADANPTGTIGMDGNSVTAMAMLLTAFSDRAVTPVEMAEFALERDYRDHNGQTGVRPAFYTEIGTYYDKVDYNGTANSLAEVAAHLDGSYHLAIIEVNNNNGTFTGGHSQLVCYRIGDKVYVRSPLNTKNPDPFTPEEWANAGWFVTAYLYSKVHG
ncbi:MAG: SH3 domain-containing protein [Clostridia bacterium]|nr:SH3 domain-containing protein [Clostridia bacterium]